MKDRYAILIMVIIEIIVHHMTTGPAFLNLEWMLGKFFFTTIILTILLTNIQKQKSYTFHKLFSKGLKIGLFFLIIYIPVKKISNYWYAEIEGVNLMDKLQNRVNDFLGDIPMLIVSFFLIGIVIFGQVLIGTCVSYLVWDKLLEKASPKEKFP